MSTRSTTHLISGKGKDAHAHTHAIVYRHSDGYPEGHGKDLQRFFTEVEEQTDDTRFSDPSYLAAKLVVWLAAEMAPYSHSFGIPEEERTALAKAKPLSFLGVGVVSQDPWDIEYRYLVDCSQLDETGRPTVTCQEVHGFDGDPTYKVVPI